MTQPADIAPPMDNNEALRRLLVKVEGLTTAFLGGITIPSNAATQIFTYRLAASSPAVRIVAANVNRKAGLLRNLDDNNSLYFGSDSSVNADTGSTLPADEGVPMNLIGPIYIFAPPGQTPLAEFTELV